MESKHRTMSVFMLPWLAHGHTSPFLSLAKKLTNRNFHVYFCSTPVNLAPVRKKLTAKYSVSIQLVELHLPSSDGLPPHYHTTNGLPPHLMDALKEALHKSAPKVSDMLRRLKPEMVIYDFIQYWAPALAFACNIPAVQFLSLSASMACYFTPDVNMGDVKFPEIRLSDYYKDQFSKIKRDNGALEARRRSWKICLIRTFREIEGKYLDHVDELFDKRTIPVGPLVKENEDEEEDGMDVDHHGLLGWLDAKKPLSTVLVSFGSEYYSSEEELGEIAKGLELSGVNFIWVVRFPAGERRSVEEILPNGFLERVEERGFVIEGWAPQMRILGHRSVGGFVSHCGWSSVLESMRIGVPIIAMPMHIDQPINARLVISLGIGMEVRRDGCGRYTREEMAEVIRKVVVEHDGKDLQKKAKDLSDTMLRKGDEDVDEAVKELVQICKDFNKLSL